MLRQGFILGLVLLFAGCAGQSGHHVHEANVDSLEASARASYAELLAANDGAKLLEEEAVGVLVFPKILKAGLTFGGQYGEGVLFGGGEVMGYYNSLSASFGLQAGVQTFGYALIFTDADALDFVRKSTGWEIGLGPSLVIADRGIGKSLTSTTVRSDIYAFVFDQKGLMAGSGLQGTKISPIHRNKSNPSRE